MSSPASTTAILASAAAARPYQGKCQYKTGKCFNERTLKRNGDAHSLCEEHRIKQNLIQRRSDRKYQTVHAERRRERSQRRAVLKKQASLAVAQQLFFEHQQQKQLALAGPIQIPFATAEPPTAALLLSFAAPIKAEPATEGDSEATPTGIDDLKPETFLALAGRAAAAEDEDVELSEAFAPIMSCRADRELWSEDDIEFLRGLLL